MEFTPFFKDELKGDILLQVWSKEGEGALRVSDATISFFPDDIRWLKSYPEENDVQLLIKNAEKVSGVTTFTHAVRGNKVKTVSYDKDLFQIISHRYGWDSIPTLRILPQKKSSEIYGSEYGGINANEKEGIVSAATIKNLVIQNHWTYVHLDLSRLGEERKDGWFSRIAELNHELEKINCRLLVTTEGRPNIRQSLNFKSSLLENDSKSNGLVVERSH